MKRTIFVKSFSGFVMVIALITITLIGLAQSPEKLWEVKLEKREGAVEANLINNLDKIILSDFQIDKGTQDGLVEGDIVCGPYSLFGKLYQVNENTALVKTISTSEEINHLLIAKERPQTLDELYENLNKSLPAVIFFPKTNLDHGSVGDAVYTIGSEAGYPEGIFVGFVADPKLAKMPESVWTVRLPIDLRHVKTVYVYHVE